MKILAKTIKKKVTPFVKRQQKLKKRAKAARRGRLAWVSQAVGVDPSGKGIFRGPAMTYDPFDKLKRAWAEWANRDRTATDKMTRAIERRERRRENRRARLVHG